MGSLFNKTLKNIVIKSRSKSLDECFESLKSSCQDLYVHLIL
jgi:hypothetical protein